MPEDYWAAAYIASAARYGWIVGYVDGTFKPDESLTRAEMATLVNRVLARRVDAAGLMSGFHVFLDLNSSHWAYYDLL